MESCAGGRGGHRAGLRSSKLREMKKASSSPGSGVQSDLFNYMPKLASL